jgi:hypothetical protein
VRNSHREIDPLFDKVRDPIEQQEPGLHGGIGIQECIDNRPDMDLPKSERRGYRQHAARLLLFGCCAAFDGIERSQHVPAGR